MILKDVKVLGFSFYSRQRVTEEVIQIEAINKYFDDIGLLVLSEYPDFEYDYFSIFSKKNWLEIISLTFSLSILNLISNQIIELVKYNDKKSYLFKSININSVNYFFRIIDLHNSDDYFSHLIMKGINKIDKQQGLKADLSDYIKCIIDEVLGAHEEYNKPEKKFLIRYLNKYAKKYSWLKIESESKFLGLYKNNKVDFERIYLPRLKMQHKEIKELHKLLLKQSPKYLIFSKALFSSIKSDFRRRIPSNDDMD